MSKSPSPHDALFKASFGRPDIARSELELVLPRAILTQLDLSTLVVLPGSYIDDDLRQTHSDLLYGVRTVSGEPSLVCVLAEHQSKYDATMALRLLEYALRVWRRWLDEHPGGKIPLLICLVLHHGEGGWSGPPELSSMFDASSSAIEATREFIPHFRYILDDLTALSVEVLAGRTIHVLGRLVQIALWTSSSLERFEQAAPLMQQLARVTTRDAATRTLLTRLYVYLLQVLRDVDARAVYDKLVEIAGPEGKEDVMTAAEQLMAKGMADGLAKGMADGLAKGMADGLAKGMADGLAKGRIETLRMAIEKALEARKVTLSEAGRARLEGCSDSDVLERWYERALTLNEESEIFGG
ncbi:Rpn family recombination-promoting nuclease/putative transposase [Pendulispora brunnea]|uniref:Rpn family recombination-promoting nuclease/putative transposase n=1 Tax=Pendulispora brunnea TaxID=2905690 RepID=A0ABZ2K2W7_9BACT